MEEEINLYFIQMGEMGPIKVGITSDIKKRLIELQTGNPEQLNVLCCEKLEAEKARSLEKEYHLMLRDASLKGEWFKPTPFVLEIIEDVKTNGVITAHLNEAERHGNAYLGRIWTKDFSGAYHTILQNAKKIREYGHFPTYKMFVNEIEDLLNDIKKGRF